jgi:hypothetical protein
MAVRSDGGNSEALSPLPNAFTNEADEYTLLIEGIDVEQHRLITATFRSIILGAATLLEALGPR